MVVKSLPMPFKGSALVLLVWAGSLLLMRSPEQSLLPHDEGYYAQQARWILETGDWLTVPWWGGPLYDRAIGLQWLIAAGYTVFGVSEGVARLPSLLCSLVSVWLTYQIGRACFGDRVGWWGAAILAVTPIWVQASRFAIQDIPLVCVELLGIWALLQAEAVPAARSRQRLLWGLLAGATVGFGFLIKSFMIVLPIVALLPYLVLDHPRHRHLSNPGLYGGLVLGALPPMVWLGLSVHQYGWLPLQQLFGKLIYLSGADFYNTTPLFYLWNIPVNGFPWPLFAIAGGIIGWQQRQHYQYSLLWLAYPLLFWGELTVFDTRTWYYPLQIYPFLALWAALCLHQLAHFYDSRWASRRRWPQGLERLFAALGVLLIGAGLLVLVVPGALGVAPYRAYGWVGLGLGLGWLLPFGVSWRDRTNWSKRPGLWQFSLLVGPWLAIAALGLTGLWGNYSADVKLALRGDPFDAILQREAIAFVIPRPDTASKEAVLLTFYTPNLGETVPRVSDLPPQTYAWVAPNRARQIPEDAVVIGTVRNWQLIQTP